MSNDVTKGYVANPRIQFVDRDGNPLSGGTVEVYKAGSTKEYVTYKDWVGTENETTITLDDTGSCTIICDTAQALKLVVRTDTGALFATYDNVTPNGGGSGGGSSGSFGDIKSNDGSIAVSKSYVDGKTIYNLSVQMADNIPPYSQQTMENTAPGTDITYSFIGEGTWEHNSGLYTAATDGLAIFDVEAQGVSSTAYEGYVKIGYKLNDDGIVWGQTKVLDYGQSTASHHLQLQVPMESGDIVVFVVNYAGQTSRTDRYTAYLHFDSAGANGGSVQWHNIAHAPSINGETMTEDTDYELQKPIIAGEHITIGEDGQTVNAEWPDLTPYAQQSALESAVSALSSDISAKQDSSAMSGYATTADLESAVTAIGSALSGKQDVSAMSAYQGTLSAGTGISIDENNVIAVTGTFGKVYSGIAPIVVDNDKDTISITGMSAYQKTADMSSYQPTADMTGYATTADITAVNSSITKINSSITQINSAVNQISSSVTSITADMSGKLDKPTLTDPNATYGLKADGTWDITQGGGDYSAGQYIKIADKVISVSDVSSLGVETPLSARVEDDGMVIYLTADYAEASALSAKQDTSAMTAYQPTGDYAYNSALTSYQQTSDMTAYQATLTFGYTEI